MSINTYPEMNETIKNLLRMSQDDPMKAYTLARIEELEEENKKLKKIINNIEKGYRGSEIDLEEKLDKYFHGGKSPIR